MFTMLFPIQATAMVQTQTTDDEGAGKQKAADRVCGIVTDGYGGFCNVCRIPYGGAGSHIVSADTDAAHIF